jgi:hypothetical protein
MYRNGQKRDKIIEIERKKRQGGKKSPSTTLVKQNDMDFFQKVSMVFLNSPC